MFVFEYISPVELVAGVLLSMLALALMIRVGGLKSWLDPMLPAVFQVVLTLLLLGVRIIPVPDVLVSFGLLLMLALGRGAVPSTHRGRERSWALLVAVLVPISIAANAFLAMQKGLLLLQEDAGVARQEFYQGWGPFQRLNAICSVLFAVHWAMQLLDGRGRKLRSLSLLLWSCYLLSTLGSKSGLLTILLSIGAAQIYARSNVSSRVILGGVLAVAGSVAIMFTLVYPEDALGSFVVRFISYVDGPFYYFQLRQPLQVSWHYPFDSLLAALRFYDALPEPGLGPAINLAYLSYDDELRGPNPQVMVEARAVAGALWPLFYAAVGTAVLWMLRWARTAYDYALITTIAAPMLIDTQFALSNALNVALALLLRWVVSRLYPIRRTRSTNDSTGTRLHLSRLQ